MERRRYETRLDGVYEGDGELRSDFEDLGAKWRSIGQSTPRVTGSEGQLTETTGRSVRPPSSNTRRTISMDAKTARRSKVAKVGMVGGVEAGGVKELPIRGPSTRPFKRLDGW